MTSECRPIDVVRHGTATPPDRLRPRVSVDAEGVAQALYGRQSSAPVLTTSRV